MSLDVSNTNVECYSGCLTSSQLVISGVPDAYYCHDGSIMMRFSLLLSAVLFLSITLTIVHKRGMEFPSLPDWCGISALMGWCCWSGAPSVLLS